MSGQLILDGVSGFEQKPPGDRAKVLQARPSDPHGT